MSRGKRTRGRKHDLFSQICLQVNLPLNESWKSKGSTITADGFEAVLEQIAKNTGIPPTYFSKHEILVSRLLHKSIEAMVLALEVINKPSIGYRLEAFLFLFINAWELLLKARIVHTGRDPKSIGEASQPDRTITFDRALKTVLSSDADPVRKNLLRLEELRNDAAHLFIDVIPPNVLLVCQAGILNYERQLRDWFKRSLSDRIPCGMIFLVSELDPQSFSLESPALAKRLPPESISYLRQWQRAVKDDVDSLPEDQVGQYAIRIDLNLALVNRQLKADIIAALDPQAGDAAAVAIRFQRLTDRYQYSYTSLVKAIKRRRPGTKQGEIDAVIGRRKIKGSPEYSAYNFRNKEQEQEYDRTKMLPKGIPVVYGINAISFILEELGPSPVASASAEQAPAASPAGDGQHLAS